MVMLGRHKLTVKHCQHSRAYRHVGGLKKLHDYTGAPVLMHRDDVPLYQAMDMQAAFLGVEPPPLSEVHQFLREGDKLQWVTCKHKLFTLPDTRPAVPVFPSRRFRKVTSPRPNSSPETRFLPEVLAAPTCGRLNGKNDGLAVHKLLALPTTPSSIRPRSHHHHREERQSNPSS